MASGCLHDTIGASGPSQATAAAAAAEAAGVAASQAAHREAVGAPQHHAPCSGRLSWLKAAGGAGAAEAATAAATAARCLNIDTAAAAARRIIFGDTHIYEYSTVLPGPAGLVGDGSISGACHGPHVLPAWHNTSNSSGSSSSKQGGGAFRELDVLGGGQLCWSPVQQCNTGRGEGCCSGSGGWGSGSASISDMRGGAVMRTRSAASPTAPKRQSNVGPDLHCSSSGSNAGCGGSSRRYQSAGRLGHMGSRSCSPVRKVGAAAAGAAGRVTGVGLHGSKSFPTGLCLLGAQAGGTSAAPAAAGPGHQRLPGCLTSSSGLPQQQQQQHQKQQQPQQQQKQQRLLPPIEQGSMFANSACSAADSPLCCGT